MKKYLVITALLAFGLVACSKKEESAPAEMNDVPKVATESASEPEVTHDAPPEASTPASSEVASQPVAAASEPASAVAAKSN